MCLVLAHQVREVSEGADWRGNPLTHAECIARMIERSGRLNPLLEAPWVKTSIFKMDWLHASDQGVAADFIGNVIFYFESVFPGASKDKRYIAIFQEIQQFYEDEDVPDRMDCLKPQFIEHKTDIKLKTSAAKCRKLVPFVLRLARELCDISNPVEEAILKAAQHLNAVYDCLSKSHIEADHAMREHSIKFASQYVALHDHLNPDDDRVWK